MSDVATSSSEGGANGTLSCSTPRIERVVADGFVPRDPSWELAPAASLGFPPLGHLRRMVAVSHPVMAGALVVRDATGAITQVVSPDRRTLFAPGDYPGTVLHGLRGLPLAKVADLSWMSRIVRAVPRIRSAASWRGAIRLQLSAPLLRPDHERLLPIVTVDNATCRPVPDTADAGGMDLPADADESVTAANAERALDLPEGWHQLWLGLCARTAFMEPEPVVGWAAEKSAELRVFWLRSHGDAAWEATEAARALSLRTCSVCGGPGERRFWGDVVATRCVEHPWSLTRTRR